MSDQVITVVCEFSRADQLIEQVAESTLKCIQEGGLSRSEIPNSLLPHSHQIHEPWAE